MCGNQILAGDRLLANNEKLYPDEMEKLLEWVKDKPEVVLVSGDVHLAELFEYPCAGHALYEITSSGLSHSIWTMYGTIASAFVNLAYPMTFSIGHRITVKNWGSLEVAFEGEKTRVVLCIRGETGEILREIEYYVGDEPRNDRKYLCTEGYLARSVKHLMSVYIVFVNPVVVLVLSLWIFLRKYTNSH